MSMSNISITFTIKAKDSLVGADNAGPVATGTYNGLENNFVSGTSGNGYAPYITNKSDYYLYEYIGEASKYIKTDSVAGGSGKLASYTNSYVKDGTSNANVPGIANSPYYKFAQTEFVSTYNGTGKSINELIGEYTQNPDGFDTSQLSKSVPPIKRFRV